MPWLQAYSTRKHNPLPLDPSYSFRHQIHRLSDASSAKFLSHWQRRTRQGALAVSPGPGVPNKTSARRVGKGVIVALRVCRVVDWREQGCQFQVLVVRLPESRSCIYHPRMSSSNGMVGT